MIDGLREYRPTEILNGIETKLLPATPWYHNGIVDRFISVFNSQLKGKTCRAFSRSNLILSKEDQPVPDVMIVCKKNVLKKNGVYGSPRLIVEVLSSSTKSYDRGYKKDLYERYGVEEYWLVDPELKEVEVYKLNEKYILDAIYAYIGEDDDTEEEILTDATIHVGCVEDLTVSLSEIFDDEWGWVE